MDYSSYIRDFLFDKGSVSLEGIGVFRKTNSSASPVEFSFDKKALTSEELIPFIAEREGKNKVLISSAVDAFLSETRQFINLGKAWNIEGIGSVQMRKDWQYHLIPIAALEENDTRKKKTVITHDIIAENYTEKKTGRGLNALVIIIILVVLGGIGWSIYSYTRDNNSVSTLNTSTVPDTSAVVDTVAHNTNIADTASVNPDTSNATLMAKQDDKLFTSSNSDSAIFKFVFERTFDYTRAFNRFSRLRTYNVRVRIDSIGTDSPRLYKLYVEKKLAGKDTSRVKDSLAVYFGTPVDIEGIRR